MNRNKRAYDLMDHRIGHVARGSFEMWQADVGARLQETMARLSDLLGMKSEAQSHRDIAQRHRAELSSAKQLNRSRREGDWS
jgi:hypothetical protein